MSEYTPRRLKSGEVKANEIAATSAKSIITSCHNCVDGLGDVLKHYKLDVKVTQLVDLVAEALVLDESQTAKEPTEAPPVVATMDEEKEMPANALRGRRILVVDDEEDVRLFLTTVLEDAGATVYTATDGDEAIAVAEREKPDLITLDLSMPGKDGIEAFTELRKTAGLEDIPVCVVTGHPEFRKLIYDRPVTPPEGYMDKPVDEDKLVSNIRRILDLKDKRN